MRLAIHIFLKDARRLKWEVGAVTALLLVTAWLNGERDPAGHQAAASALFLLSMVALCYLVIRVVQTDALVGTDEDWMTRPVGRGHLAGAKALGLATFLVLPVAVGVVLMLSRQGLEPWSRPGALAWYVVCFALMMVAPAAAVGAVTRGVAAAVVSAVAMVAAVGLSESMLPARTQHWGVMSVPVWVPLSLVGLTAALGGLGVLWVQYGTGKVRAARSLAVVAVLLAAVGQSAVGWDQAFALQQTIGGEAEDAAVRLEAQPLGGGKYTLRLSGLGAGRRGRILKVEGFAETAGGRTKLERWSLRFGQPHSELNVRAAGEATRMTGVVWYQVLEAAGESEAAVKKDAALEGAPGRCVLHVEKMKRDGLDPLVLCRWAFRSPEEVTVAVRMGEWESRQDVLRGTQAGSPFPAELGLPVSTGVTGVLPEGEFRLEEAAEKGGRFVFRRWRARGYFRQEFRIDGGL